MVSKKDMVISIAESTGLKRKDVETVCNEIFNMIGSSVVDGEDVSIPSFGKFVRKTRDSRVCRNPQTGEQIVTAEHNVVQFKPSSVLKNAVR